MKRLLLPLVFFVAAHAGASMDPFDLHAADLLILQAKTIQNELKVTEAQRKQMNDAAAADRTKRAALDKDFKAGKITQDAARKMVAQLFQTLKENVLSSLTAPQLKRLREISLQRVGLIALADEKIATRVGLNATQLKQYREVCQKGAELNASIQRQAAEPIMAKYKGVQPKNEAEAKELRTKVEADFAAARAKVTPQLKAIESATTKKLLAILTPAQKAAWEALKGKPFKG